MITTRTRSIYARFRQAGYPADQSLRAARILRKWDALWRCGAVRLRAEIDQDFTPGPDNCDCDDPRCPSKAKDAEAFGTIGEYRTDWADRELWHMHDADDRDYVQADSCWGHVGYQDATDPVENPYVLDHMAETIAQFRDAWKDHVGRKPCTACHGSGFVLA